MMTPIPFTQFMAEKVGQRWAIVKRRTAKLRERYDGVLLLPREFDALYDQYEQTFGVPAYPTR